MITGYKFQAYCFILGALIMLAPACSEDKPMPPEPVSDIEDNSYKTVEIGTQIWMAENLLTTRFNDGTEIPLISESDDWSKTLNPAYCWYDNNQTEYKEPYGALYNGYAVKSGKLCPTGWHVPEREEWLVLRDFLSDSLKAGGKLKEEGITHWLTPNKGADNSTGFNALASGLRYFQGSYALYLHNACFWSSTETGTGDMWYMVLYYGDATFTQEHRSELHGFSVRCIKD